MEYSSCFEVLPKPGQRTSRVSSFEYLRFQSSMTSVGLGSASRGCLGLGAACPPPPLPPQLPSPWAFGCSFLAACSFLGFSLLVAFWGLVLDSLVDEIGACRRRQSILAGCRRSRTSGLRWGSAPPLLVEEKLEAAGDDAGSEEVC